MKSYRFIQFIYLLLFICAACSQNASSSDAEKGQAIPTSIQDQGNSISTFSPLQISSDQGLNWTPVQGLPSTVQITFMDQIGSELVIATEGHSLLISEGNMTRWKSIGTLLPHPKISALEVIDKEIFICVFQHGLYSSQDNGLSWINHNQNIPDVKILDILSTQSELLIATDSGIYKSVNGTQEWKQVFSSRQAVSLQQSEDKIIAGTTGGVVLSTNNGETWESIHKKGAIHNTAILDGVIFAMYISGDLFVSDDWGKTWTEAFYSPKTASYVYEVSQSGEYFIMSNNYGVHRSIDRGKTWNLIFGKEDYIFFDFHEINGQFLGGFRKV